MKLTPEREHAIRYGKWFDNIEIDELLADRDEWVAECKAIEFDAGQTNQSSQERIAKLETAGRDLLKYLQIADRVAMLRAEDFCSHELCVAMGNLRALVGSPEIPNYPDRIFKATDYIAKLEARIRDLRKGLDDQAYLQFAKPSGRTEAKRARLAYQRLAADDEAAKEQA